MKKYLMIGFAAVAFAACSNHDFETYTQTDVDKAKYDQAFEKYVGGKVASNQDWGFGASTRAFTRADINVNGNLWEEIPGFVTNERQLVFDYVNMTRAQMRTAEHKYQEEFPRNLKNYWVTHVWTGTDTYKNGGNADIGIGSTYMNNLHIAESADAKLNFGSLTDGWFHVNNFNRGNNTDWSGNTLVTNAGTYDFAYHGSADSRYHNKWITVKGEDIDASLAGKYYVCFDFEAVPLTVYTIFENPDENGQKYNVEGKWDNIADAIAAGARVIDHYVYEDTEQPWVPTGIVYSDKVLGTNWKWTQLYNDNQVVDANDVYTDWIIRLVEAQPKADIRIIAEDLNANQSDNDWDFNDVVLDIKYGTTAADTKVILRAAGGTMKLRIAENDEWEVHNLFDVDVNVMVNTNWTGSNKATKDPVVIPYNQAIPDAAAAKALKLEVFKNGEWQELKATTGQPACKIGVKPTFLWLNERESLKEKHPLFTEWVTSDPSIEWY